MFDESNRINSFMNMKTIDDLMYVLNISQKKFNYLIHQKRNIYTSFYINKSNGEKRNILAPCRELKKIQHDLYVILSNNYMFDENVVHGFIKNNNIKTNATIHKNANYILNIDLKNFFDTIHFGRVRGMFMKPPFSFPNFIATNLAKVTCYEKKLPQGAPTSPIISNIICYRLDRELKHLCDKYNCDYTRYADDITISTKMLNFPKEIAMFKNNQVILSKKILSIIQKEGFYINNNKINFSSLSNRQEVTGLIVNKKVNVKKIYLKKIRALLYNTSKYGFYIEGCKYLENEKINFNNRQLVINRFTNILKGKIEFLKMVRGLDDRVYIKYAEQFNKLIGYDYFDVDYGLTMKQFMEKRIFPIFRYDAMRQGTCFIAEKYGMITSTHVLVDEAKINNQINEFYYNDIYFEPFYFLDHYNKAFIINPYITRSNIDSDCLNYKYIYTKKYLKINLDYEPAVAEKVYLAGYGEFRNYITTPINYIETQITGTSEFMGRKIYCIKDQIYHGMSGGPVLNEKREVIGIIYVGLNINNAETKLLSKSNGFILLKKSLFDKD